MKCKQIEKYVPDYFAGELEKDKKVLIEKHLKQCENCRKEVEELRILWDNIGKLPDVQPDEELRSRFIEKVDAIKAYVLVNQAGRDIGRKLLGYWKSYPVLKAAAIVVLFLSGLFSGYLLGENSGVQNDELALMRAEISELALMRAEISELALMRAEISQLNQLVTMSILQQPSPSSRLLGINWVDMMYDDPNIDVWLARGRSTIAKKKKG